MEEMMTVITAFIRGETAAASKKKGHTLWKPQDQPKRHASERKSDFRVTTSSKEILEEAEVRHENFKIALHPNFLDQEVAIEGTLSAKERTDLCSLLKENLDIFAWQPLDMTGVPRSIAEHRLNIREGYSPVRHKKRGQAPERARAIQAEVQKLVEVRIMREVYYHDWLSNPVMVKKHDGSWRMCIDFTDLNKACLKDCYPLPKIDWNMAESDEEKAAFHTSQGVYCYTKMPFGLKNASATYQRLVDKAFDSQIGRNIEVYVDDLVIKSYTKAEMLRDIDETFCMLRRINMKLNPKKCTFGAMEGMFLGYMISPERIKPCPDKTEAVLQLPSPRTIKEVQSLNGKLASLNRFLSKSAEKSLPLFKTLKKCIKKSDFHWTSKAEQAFKQLKQHLSIPKKGGGYHVPELNYTPMEKLVLALVFAAKRLRRYFHAHPIAILANFLVEKPDEAPPDTSVVEIPQESLTLFTDGSSCVDGSGAGLILISPGGTEFTYALRFQFTASNNEAEYEALIAGLRIAAQMGVRNVNVSVDSKLVANQSLGTYVPKRKICHTEAEMLRDIDETFRTLRRINMKLNPKKCTFGTVEEMFLGYMISPEGIKPCTDKTKVVLQLPSPRTIKEVQSLNEKLASLNRFLSKSVEKSLPLFKTLKKCIKKSDFHWTPEAEQAFKQLKQHLSKLPLLVAPKPKEELIVYLSASHGAISAVLMTERGTVQTPVYFRYAGRTQYHVPAKDIRERTDSSRFPCREAGQAPPDTWIKRWPNTDKPGGNGVYLRAKMGVRNVHVSVDSKLVANQVLGTYVAKEENMVKYLEKDTSRISDFTNFSISQVPRSKNKKADALSKIASTSFAHLSKQVLVKVLKEKSIQEDEVATVVEEEGPTWMTPIMEYLKDGTFPDDRKEASKLRIKARQYELLERVLYRRSFLKSWLRCVGPLQADYVIREIHEGSCSMHAGPFSEGPGKVKFLIVAMNYFTKWIETKAMTTITGNQVKKFVWDNIVCLFSLPGEIVSDNGKQFNDNPFKDWCEKLNITQRFASVKHPRSNGLVERANRSLGEGIKARLGEGNKNWIEELPHVLWAHSMMIKSSHGDTPFSLTYGTKAVIPAEIRMPTYRTVVVDVIYNNEELRLNLDLLEERRERAAIREARAKLKMTKYYNARVRGVTFRPGDFFYRSNEASHAMNGGKLSPKWEGPYEVTEALGDRAYRLRSMDDTVLPRMWNIANLKKCYL
ncbi:reverse transcriptase domain-containing protein [Tanacetum coccineum]